MDINLNLNQLKIIRGVLSLKRCYKPYEERGDTNVPKGILWNDDLEDLLIQVEAAIQRQSPNCPPWSPYGSFPTIIEESRKLNEKMNQSQLTKEDFDLIAQVFSSAASLDIDSRLVEDGDTTHDHFSSVWDKVIDRGN
jgi:hypothetical protein